MATEPTLSPLIGQILQANAAYAADVTNRLVDSLTEQLSEAHARADAVEDGVMRLISGDFMPTPAAIRNALHPSKETVARYRREDGVR